MLARSSLPIIRRQALRANSTATASTTAPSPASSSSSSAALDAATSEPEDQPSVHAPSSPPPPPTPSIFRPKYAKHPSLPKASLAERTVFVRPYHGVPSMLQALAIVRFLEGKFGEVESYNFPRSPDSLHYMGWGWLTFSSTSSAKRCLDVEHFSIPEPSPPSSPKTPDSPFSRLVSLRSVSPLLRSYRDRQARELDALVTKELERRDAKSESEDSVGIRLMDLKVEALVSENRDRSRIVQNRIVHDPDIARPLPIGGMVLALRKFTGFHGGLEDALAAREEELQKHQERSERMASKSSRNGPSTVVHRSPSEQRKATSRESA